MPEQPQQLCQRCNERKAVRYICYGNTGESKRLCERCYRESASPEELAASDRVRNVIRNGKCEYCGAPAVGGSVYNEPSTIPGEWAEKTNLWCGACNRDLREFGKQPGNAVSPWPFDDEAAQERVSREWAERDRRKEEFMKQRIAERKRKA